MRDTLALALVGAGLLAGAGVALRTRAPLEGLRWLLDFLLAAGLLRLSATGTPAALATAAAVVAVRQIIGLGIRRGRTVRAALPAGRPGPDAGGETGGP